MVTAGADVSRLLPNAARLPTSLLGIGTGALGVPLGAYGAYRGVNEMRRGEYSAGALDTTAGVLGMGSGLTGMAAGAGALGGGLGASGLATGLIAAAPPLAIAAGAAGLAAYGNETAQENGWYGRERDNPNENATFLSSMGNRAQQGWQLGNRVGTSLIGNNMVGRGVGNGLGAVAGGLGGLWQGEFNAGAAMVGGVSRMTGIGSGRPPTLADQLTAQAINSSI